MVNQVSISIQNAISDSDGPDKDCCSPKLVSSSASSRNSWPSLISFERTEDPNEIRHLLFFAYEGTSRDLDSAMVACMFFRMPRVQRYIAPLSTAYNGRRRAVAILKSFLPPKRMPQFQVHPKMVVRGRVRGGCQMRGLRRRRFAVYRARGHNYICSSPPGRVRMRPGLEHNRSGQSAGVRPFLPKET
jgi:hypothetical protein